MRTLVALALTLAVSGLLPVQLRAQPAPDTSIVQFRDLSFKLPGNGWQRIMPDPDPTQAGKRVLLGREEPLHGMRLVIAPAESTQPLTPSEVASQVFAAQARATRDDGKLSDFNSGTRTIGGVDYRWSTERFTPSSGPPISERNVVLIFPNDFADRQRLVIVQIVDTHSATANALPLDDLDSLVTSLQLRPLGTVLASDDFSDPAAGALRNRPSSDHFTVDVVDGELALVKTDFDWPNFYIVNVPGVFSDASVAVDARTEADDETGVFTMYCRRRTGAAAYRVVIDPSRARARLELVKADSGVDNLTPWTESPAIQTSGSNHFDFICRGSLVELDSNGTRVASVRNNTITEDGSFAIGGGTFNDRLGMPELRFANLVVAQR